jgi:dynein heavy chain
MFEIKQHEYRTQVSEAFEAGYKKIMAVLRSMYKNFGEGTTEVLREWKSQIVYIDRMMEQALKKVVKKSLQELSKAINGDAKTEPQLLFTAHIILDISRLSYRPSMVSLTNSVNLVAKDIINGVSVVPRIRSQGFDTPPPANEGGYSPVGRESEKFKSYYDVIADDPEILKLVVQIMNGMSSTATELQKYLLYWDKYKGLWETDKEAFIRKYSKANRSPSQFDSQIQVYRNDQNDIQNEFSSNVVWFVRVDCNILKETLTNHCLQFQSKLTGLLNQNGYQELKDIFDLFERSRENLASQPSNLEELSNKIALAKELKEQVQSLQNKFQPIREIYVRFPCSYCRHHGFVFMYYVCRTRWISSTL